jgi:hypothetical protein
LDDEGYLPSAKAGSTMKLSDKTKSKILKSELYLKYSLLVDLMKVVKKHGRKPEYDWDKDPDLSLIKNVNGVKMKLRMTKKTNSCF